MKKNHLLLNIVSGIILQIINIINSFILPKIILANFGSELNGLVTSLNQFLGYASLFEGGVTGILIAKLYKPLASNDNEELSEMIVTANRFYRKLAMIILIYSVSLSMIFPILFKSSFNYLFVISLGLILSINFVIQYASVLSLRSLLVADGKLYIINIVQITVIVINIIFVYISILIYPSIHVFKLIGALLTLLFPIIFTIYTKKTYNIDYYSKTNKSVLEDRWSGFSINLATFIHMSTDVVVLTVFTDFYTVSIYSIYYLVVTGLDAIVSIITKSITPIIGRVYARKEKNKLVSQFHSFESLIMFVVFVLFTVAYKLIVPFVMIYTKNIYDVDYYRPLFASLLLISEMIYLLMSPYVELSTIANKFKDMAKPSFIEALLNIVISICLVSKLGLVGVAIGTIVGMLYRYIFQLFLSNKILELKRTKVIVKKLIIYILTMIMIMIIYKILGNIEYNVINWILHGILYTIISIAMYYLVSKVILKEDIIVLIQKLKN